MKTISENGLCEVCENKKRKMLGQIKYFGAVKYCQELVLCDRCGLISSNKKIPYEHNSMASDKDDYLSESIILYLRNVFHKINAGKIDLSLSHINNSILHILGDYHGSYDLLVISEYLEHALDLTAVLEKIKKLGSKYVFIEAPIYDMCEKKDTDLFGYFIKSHNYYFSSYTLTYFMNKIGYSLIDMKFDFGVGLNMPMVFPCIFSVWELNSNRVMVSSSKSDILGYISQCSKELEKISDQIDSIVSNDMPIAVWGTGNYSEKLFAMTPLRKKNIVKIYDGDCKKWGSQFAGINVSEFKVDDIQSGLVKRIFIASNTSQMNILDLLVNQFQISKEYILTI